jgi:hypothetical protein
MQQNACLQVVTCSYTLVVETKAVPAVSGNVNKYFLLEECIPITFNSLAQYCGSYPTACNSALDRSPLALPMVT